MLIFFRVSLGLKVAYHILTCLYSRGLLNTDQD
jgi:hypothetical protein